MLLKPAVSLALYVCLGCQHSSLLPLAPFVPFANARCRVGAAGWPLQVADVAAGMKQVGSQSGMEGVQGPIGVAKLLRVSPMYSKDCASCC